RSSCVSAAFGCLSADCAQVFRQAGRTRPQLHKEIPDDLLSPRDSRGSSVCRNFRRLRVRPTHAGCFRVLPMRCPASLVVSFVLASLSLADDWPQWLGPNRDGTTKEIVAPWKGDLKVLWRVEVGEGHSSPVVAGGRVYLHTKDKTEDKETLQSWH